MLHKADIDATWEVVEVEVTNHTTHSINISSFPTKVKQDWQDKDGGGSGEGAPSRVKGTPYPFTVLKRQGNLRFRIYLPIEMMAPGAKPHLTLEYLAKAGPQMKGAWLGLVPVKVVSNSK